MSILGAFKSAFTTGAREINKEFAKSDEFLKGVCAGCSLVAYADGTLDDDERKQAIAVLTGHTQISALFQRNQIESALQEALNHGQTSSGKQELARQLDAVLNRPNGAQMAEDVYLVSKDVASMGGIGKEEQDVLDKIAKRLKVDTSKFEF